MHIVNFSVNKAGIEECVALIEYLYQHNLVILIKHGVISLSPNESSAYFVFILWLSHCPHSRKAATCLEPEK